jgi:hypothetical protein
MAEYRRKVKLKHTLPTESDDEKYLSEMTDIEHSLEELERSEFSETEKDEFREKLEAKRSEIEDRYRGDRSIRDLIMELIEDEYYLDLDVAHIYELLKRIVGTLNELKSEKDGQTGTDDQNIQG